jgi:hypothetical protein
MKRPPILLWLWLAAAAGGSVWLRVQGKGPWISSSKGWRAAQDLRKNHQISEGDIEGPKEHYLLAGMLEKRALIGKHLLRARKKGEIISTSDFASQPNLEPVEVESGVWLYALKGNEYLTDGTQVGSWVRICSVRKMKKNVPETHCSKDPIPVDAVHRSTTSGDSTWVALRVPNRRFADVGEYISSEGRFLLVAAQPPSGLKTRSP